MQFSEGHLIQWNYDFLEIMCRNNNGGKAGIATSIPQQPGESVLKGWAGEVSHSLLPEVYLEHLSLELLAACCAQTAWRWHWQSLLKLGGFGVVFVRSWCRGVVLWLELVWFCLCFQVRTNKMVKTSSIWLWRNLLTERIILLFSKAGSNRKNLGGVKGV